MPVVLNLGMRLSFPVLWFLLYYKQILQELLKLSSSHLVPYVTQLTTVLSDPEKKEKVSYHCNEEQCSYTS